MPFDIDDSVSIAWDVFDADGDPTNAGTAVLTVTKPDGTVETPSVPAPVVTGQYRVVYIPDVAGRYTWRAVTTLPNTAYADVFEVREAMSPSLISLADAKAHLNIPVTSTTHDSELREYIEAMTRIVEQYVGPIVTRSYTRRVCGYTSSILLPHTQVREVTAITLVQDGSSPINLADLSIDSEAGIVTMKGGSTFPYGEMDWTYTVGRDYVHPNWTLAAKMILDFNWKSQLGNLPSIQGDEDRGYVFAGQEIPPRAEMLLAPDAGNAGFA
jgi:hypothetical protein